MSKDVDGRIKDAEAQGYRISKEFRGPIGSGKTTRATAHSDSLARQGLQVLVLRGLIDPQTRAGFDVVMSRKSGRH